MFLKGQGPLRKRAFTTIPRNASDELDDILWLFAIRLKDTISKGSIKISWFSVMTISVCGQEDTQTEIEMASLDLAVTRNLGGGGGEGHAEWNTSSWCREKSHTGQGKQKNPWNKKSRMEE